MLSPIYFVTVKLKELFVQIYGNYPLFSNIDPKLSQRQEMNRNLIQDI